MSVKVKVNLKLKPKSTKTLRVFEAFAGVGTATFALKRLHNINFETIGFSEIDKYAIQIYLKNHGNIKNYSDITKINEIELPDFELFTGGFPCQPFSTAGKGLGEEDITRGTLFNDIIRILRHKKPQHVLLENVKGLLSKSHRYTFDKIISELESIGYNVNYALLNSYDYGNAQNRERLWIYATTKIGIEPFQFPPKTIHGHIRDYVDRPENIDKSLYLSDKQIERLIELHKVDFNVNEVTCLDIYNKKLKVGGVCPTLTLPNHNSLRIVEPKTNRFMVRKLSVTEHFRLMGFKHGEIDFDNLSYTQLCKLAGNGWDIGVVELLLLNIL